MAIIFAKEAPLSIASITSLATALFLIGYVVYQRYLHPLAKFPGPFLASLTDLWQVHQYLTLKQPYNLTKLHEKYGPIVRYGPDKLSVIDESAVSTIYQKGAKMMPKTEFYDAFAAAHPSVFSMKDEAQYSVRRKILSQGFSHSFIRELEPHLDANVELLLQRLDSYSSTNESFDLKEALHHYLIDALGELAFGESFGVLATGDKARVPPTIEPSLLATVTGAWPLMTKVLKKWLPLIPQRTVQQLFRGKQACAVLASKKVERRMAEIGEKKSGDCIGRKDFLSNLIIAKDPYTGDFLSKTQIEAEAFGFIIAGTHITTAASCLLFYHLLHTPGAMDRCVAEIAHSLPPLQNGQSAYSLAAAESSLPYLQKCVKENFRINPVVTFPLARRVLSPEGIMIGQQHIPQGTSIGISTHAFHHNPKIWGADHNVFDPSRWDNQETAAKSNLLMHFGAGGRQCIGRVVAMTNIYKLASTILKKYELELADEEERRLVMEGDFIGRLPDLISHGLSSLEGPIMVRVRKRAGVS